MTPGVLLSPPWSLGVVTNEGLEAALEQTLRLTSMLALVAFIFSALGRSAIIAGIHAWLLPLKWIGFNRDAIALRLMLTLDFMTSDKRRWDEFLYLPAQESALPISLPAMKIRVADVIFSSTMATIVVMFWGTS